MRRQFTDWFICRPVLAMVVSFLLLVIGVKSYFGMQIREYPKLYNTMITVHTSYPGANASLVEGFITSILEQSIAGAEGVDYMTSRSRMGSSSISIYVKNDINPNQAFTDVSSLVSSQLNRMPRSAENPVITKKTGSSEALMYVGFMSKHMSASEINDYVIRAVKPKLFTVPGISQIQVFGGAKFAMRIWIDIDKMTGYHVSLSELKQALINNNVQSAAGQIKNHYMRVDVFAKTGIKSATQFKNLIVKKVGNSAIRVKDIARVDLGKESYGSNTLSSQGKLIIAAIYPTPDANELDVSAGLAAIFPKIKKSYPPTLSSHVLYDSSRYIASAIADVVKALWEAIAIIFIVIFIFLGSFRAILIPVIVIPLSLVGTFFIMHLLSYSINLMTLLAMVIAVSLVVDDAIVVMENIYRHIEDGASPFQAAIHGARDIANPVIVMTLTLVVVYLPIGFMGGMTGTLFTEFAFTLAATVVVSGVVALTLTPMMTSKILSADSMNTRLVQRVDHFFSVFRRLYEKVLDRVLSYSAIVVFLTCVVIASCGYFFIEASKTKQLAPPEDVGVVFAIGFSPQYANLDYDMVYAPQILKSMQSSPGADTSFVVSGFDGSRVLAIMTLKPWDKRPNLSTFDIIPKLQQKFFEVPGLFLFAMQPPPLPSTGDGSPISLELMSLKPTAYIHRYAMQLMLEASKSGLFASIRPDIFLSKPQLVVSINREKAGMLGIQMSDISSLLSSAMGGGHINYFSLEGKSYEVIPQVQRRFRLDPNKVGQLRIKAESGEMVPLSTFVSFSYQVIPNELTHFQQLNSVSLSGSMKQGHTIGEGLDYLKKAAKKILPNDISLDYSGQSRQFIQEGDAMIYAFLLALLIIYLVLSAQFESFRDPIIILIAVPLSVFGAMLPIFFGYETLNIYTEVGLLTLIGLISKHGILIVQFANELRASEGLSKREAIIKASGIRMRPVLMTTAAMVFGMLPLIFATGAGAASNQAIGTVVSYGMFIGTCFTLFVVPGFYLLLSGKHQPLRTPEDP